MFKAAPCLQPERKRVGFLIQTDSTECPNITYALSAAVYPEWEVRALPESSRTVPIGRAGRQVMEVIARRQGEEGRTLPARVEADSPLTVRFLTEPRDQMESSGLTTRIRDVEIALPVSSKAEDHRGSIRFAWPDGRTQQQPVSWAVVPTVRVSPSRLVMRRSDRDVTHVVVIKASDGRPFRIRNVGPSQMVVSSEFDHEVRRAQTLKFRIDPDRLLHEQDAKVTIQTDIEDQPNVSLSVVILPPGV